jgi:anti-anti-sigma factor
MVAAYAWNGFTDPKHVTLNCTGVRTINGLGASILVKLSARAKNNGQRLSAFAVSEDLRQIFRVTELDQAIQVHASETDALAAAGVSGEQSSVQATEESGVLVNLTSWARSVSELFVPEMPKEALC